EDADVMPARGQLLRSLHQVVDRGVVYQLLAVDEEAGGAELLGAEDVAAVLGRVQLAVPLHRVGTRQEGLVEVEGDDGVHAGGGRRGLEARAGPLYPREAVRLDAAGV